MTNPIFSYPHSSGLHGRDGGSLRPERDLASRVRRHVLAGDFVCGKIVRLTPSGSGGFTAPDFVTGLGTNGITSMEFGPHGRTRRLSTT